MESRSILELIEKIEKILPSQTSGLSREIKDALKQTIEDHLHKLNIVTREEFDVQKEIFLSLEHQNVDSHLMYQRVQDLYWLNLVLLRVVK